MHALFDPGAHATLEHICDRTLLFQGLDFEDKIGDVACRFRYRNVPSIDTGLRADQILTASDKDLNQVLGMRRLAAYRDDRRNMRPNFQKVNELRRQDAPPSQAPSRSKPKKARRDKEMPGKHEQKDGKHESKAEETGIKRNDPAAEGEIQQPEQKTGSIAKLDGGEPKQQQQQQQTKKKKRRLEALQSVADPAAQRMQSYAKLTLKRSSDGKAKIAKQHAPPAPAKQPADAGPQLTRAQKRNLRKSEKRAAARAAKPTPA